jgi:UDP-N-acetylglucosamine acyltransferase
MAVGQPAEPHSINATGLSRRGFTPEQVRNIKNAYRTLYRTDLKLADAVPRLEEAAKTQPELRIFVDFIGRSTRSLVR